MNSAKGNDHLAVKTTKRRREVKSAIEAIYRAKNPAKLSEIDGLMHKYKGKEDELLAAIQQKYSNISGGSSGGNKNDYKPWQFSLKSYAKDDKILNKNIAASLAEVRTELDGMAASIGGECLDIIDQRSRVRKFVVRQRLCSNNTLDQKSARRVREREETIEPTVEKMRQIVHDRYQYRRNAMKSKAHLQTEEHERRREEKRVDQLKKKGKGRRSYKQG